MPSRRPSASRPPDAAPSPAALFAALPDSFQTAAVDFTAAPFARLTYAYPARPPARLDLAVLPVPMRQEMAYWLHTLAVAGERVNSWMLAEWVQVAAGAAADGGVSSFTAPERGGVGGRGPAPLPRPAPPAAAAQLPAQPPGHHRPAARGADAGLPGRPAMVALPVWDPRHDRRIPVRAHEPLEGQRLNFTRVSPAWLREAIQWYFAAGLSTGLLSWTSLPGYLSYLGRHFAAFLAAEGIGTPDLGAGPEAGIRPVALRLAAWLRQQRTRSGRPLAPLHHRADPDHGGRVLRLHGRPARRSRPGTGRAAVGRADRCPRPLVAARRDRRPVPRPGRGQLHRRGGPVPHRRACRDPRAAPRPGQDRGGERDATPDPGAGR